MPDSCYIYFLCGWYMYMFICVCVCASVYACMCMYVCMHVCMHVCMCAYICVCMYVHMCMCMYVCVCVYMCVYMYMRVHACAYVYVEARARCYCFSLRWCTLFFEEHSLTEPGAHRPARLDVAPVMVTPGWSSCDANYWLWPRPGVIDNHAWLFMWVLGIQTWMLMLV